MVGRPSGIAIRSDTFVPAESVSPWLSDHENRGRITEVVIQY